VTCHSRVTCEPFSGLESGRFPAHVRAMWKSDIICPECGAGYRRVVLASCKGTKGEYRCLASDHVLEAFDGSFEVLIRLTIQPEKTFH
jgi:hypothetical protein